MDMAILAKGHFGHSHVVQLMKHVSHIQNQFWPQHFGRGHFATFMTICPDQFHFEFFPSKTTTMKLHSAVRLYSATFH